MTARLILLNGPAGVGKTTVGRLLAGLVPNGACIHGDSLKDFVVSRVEGAVGGGLGYVNGAASLAPSVAVFVVPESMPLRTALAAAAISLGGLIAATVPANPFGPVGGGD